MTTFKNNSKYAELIFTYLEVAERPDSPLTYEEVLGCFQWNFKGGSLHSASSTTRLKPETSEDVYPHGSSSALVASAPSGQEFAALRVIVQNRLLSGRMKTNAVLGRLGTFHALTLPEHPRGPRPKIFSGMKSIYHLFGLIWEWSKGPVVQGMFSDLEGFTRELMVATAGVSRVDLPTAEEKRQTYWSLLSKTRVPGLLLAIQQMKRVIAMVGRGELARCSRLMGLEDLPRWQNAIDPKNCGPVEEGMLVLGQFQEVGPILMQLFQNCTLVGRSEIRYALGKSDMERLHQVLMSSASAIVGVCAQAVVGTPLQRSKASQAVIVAQNNISRIVESSKMVPLGDEVLVCKGYRRAYTAFLGVLAGKLCEEETKSLVEEAVATAPEGVLDVHGMLYELRTLDAANALNAAKMFKICPAPDVSPGLAMMDRISQVGNLNQVNQGMMLEFERELRTQILRAYLRSRKSRKKLKVRENQTTPIWYPAYLEGNMDQVPSSEIHTYLEWEGTGEMPEVSPNDPRNWKDSGIGADSMREAFSRNNNRKKSNMMTRLLYDDNCPMPGRMLLNPEHVIKFFVKAEGHKDPARGIFSANLTDRQAQSWMERGVEKVASHHPSFMIGQAIDLKDLRVAELTNPPQSRDWVALYYSFDISGWSAKMPAEPQRISHKIWADLYGGHLYSVATQINEGAIIYMDLDGYRGWYKNTASNLEGFNGKEMTMVLIALLSLAVRRWRAQAVEAGLLSEAEAESTSAMLLAYIDDGLSRIDLPKAKARDAFNLYKEVVIETFDMCGFSVEVSKCFPSDRFSIFLNEVYLGGRHVVHGVRAAMGISAEPTERHTSLVERVTSVSTGIRGAVMAGLNPLSGSFLMAYHVMLHLAEWVPEKDPVVLATWCVCPRGWGGLGLPNMLQTFVSGSGSALEEGIATLQIYSMSNRFARSVFLALCKTPLMDRTHTSVMTAPLSARVIEGYMIDSRVTTTVRVALKRLLHSGRLSRYATRLLTYADSLGFDDFAEALIPLGSKEVLQEQMLDNACESHPHTIFSSFARRLEKSMTLQTVMGNDLFQKMIGDNRREAKTSVSVLRSRSYAFRL